MKKKTMGLQSSAILLQCKSTEKKDFIQYYLFTRSKAGLRYFSSLSLRGAPLPIQSCPYFFF